MVNLYTLLPGTLLPLLTAFKPQNLSASGEAKLLQEAGSIISGTIFQNLVAQSPEHELASQSPWYLVRLEFSGNTNSNRHTVELTQYWWLHAVYIHY